MLNADAVPEDRAKQFEDVEKKLATQAADITAHDTHVPEAISKDLEAKRPTRILSDIPIYATLGFVCLIIGVAFFGLGRLISKQRGKKRVSP